MESDHRTLRAQDLVIGMSMNEHLLGKRKFSMASCLVNKLHDFTEIHDLNGNLPYDDFVGKTHTRLYVNPPYQIVIKKVEGFAVDLFWTLQSIMNFTGSLNFPAKGNLFQAVVLTGEQGQKSKGGVFLS